MSADAKLEIIGPFPQHYRLSVGGYRVPYLEATPLNDEKTRWGLTLDERYYLELEQDDKMNQIVWFIANAMAVSAGYSSHGENCQPTNPFTVKMVGLSSGDWSDLQAGDDVPEDNFK